MIHPSGSLFAAIINSPASQRSRSAFYIHHSLCQDITIICQQAGFRHFNNTHSLMYIILGT